MKYQMYNFQQAAAKGRSRCKRETPHAMVRIVSRFHAFNIHRRSRRHERTERALQIFRHLYQQTDNYIFGHFHQQTDNSLRRKPQLYICWRCQRWDTAPVAVTRLLSSRSSENKSKCTVMVPSESGTQKNRL